MDFNWEVGKRILFYCKVNGIKLTAMSDYLDYRCGVRMDSAKMSITLHGKRKLTLIEYALICDFLRVDYGYFLSGITTGEKEAEE